MGHKDGFRNVMITSGLFMILHVAKSIIFITLVTSTIRTISGVFILPSTSESILDGSFIVNHGNIKMKSVAC